MLSENLKTARNNANYTQDDVAKYLNVKRQTYGAYETGKSTPNPDTLIMLAKFYDVSADYLLGLTDDPTPKKTLTPDDELNQAISKLTPKGRERTKEYIDLLKTREEFTQEVAESLDLNRQKPLPE